MMRERSGRRGYVTSNRRRRRRASIIGLSLILLPDRRDAAALVITLTAPRALNSLNTETRERAQVRESSCKDT